VLMEERGAACQFLGRVVFEDGSDDRAFRKCWLLREYATGDSRDRRAESQHFQCLPASHRLREKL